MAGNAPPVPFSRTWVAACVAGGQYVGFLQVKGSAVQLLTASSWEVYGDTSNPLDWRYRCESQGPSKIRVVRMPSEGVCNIRYAWNNEEPWKGISPLNVASDTAKLAGNMELRLSEESGTVTGYVLPVPEDGQNNSLDSLRKDLGSLKGSTSIVETTSAGWNQGRGSAPQTDWKPVRLGMNVPKAIVDLRVQVTETVLAACGIPPQLFGFSSSSATAGREAWRSVLHGTIEPVASLVSEELSRILEDDVRLSFEELFASDIQGRTRAFQSMVTGGMEIPKAASHSGLISCPVIQGGTQTGTNLNSKCSTVERPHSSREKA